MSLSLEPRNTEEAIEKLLLEAALLKKQNQDLVIAKVRERQMNIRFNLRFRCVQNYAEELIAQLQAIIENQQRQINELTKKVCLIVSPLSIFFFSSSSGWW